VRGYLLPGLIAVLVALAATTGLAAARSEATNVVRHKPTAALTFAVRVTAKGKYFKKREMLTVTLSSSAIQKTWTKRVRATVKGTFTADFGSVTGLSSSDPYTLKVVGSLKSRFTTSVVRHKPTAVVTFSTRVTAKGKDFKKGEMLTVTLSSSTIEMTWTKRVRATVKGTFTADFGSATGLNSCNQYTLKVVGSLKSRFTTSHAFVPC
jgi:hypothetical protein